MPAAWTDRLAVFDLETTGVDPREARIVTAYVGELDSAGTVVAERAWLLDPGVEIPEGAAAVHGISTERARAEGQDAAMGVGEIVQAIRMLQAQGVAVVAYNAAYDFTVLHAEAERRSVPALADPRPVIDPLVLDKHVDRYRKGKRTLGIACEHYGVVLDDWHTASADAIAAGRLALAMAERHDALRVPAAELHASTVGWAREQAEDFAAYMRRVRDPAFVAESGWPVRHA